MNFIFYTAQTELQHFLMNAIPPSFSKEFFDTLPSFSERLAQLTHPAQIIIDYDSFHGDICQLLCRHKMHHFVCLSYKSNFELILKIIRHGGILSHPHELSVLDWWWNRSLIQFQKKPHTSLPKQFVLFVPSTPKKKIKSFLQENAWRLFFETKPLVFELNGEIKGTSIFTKTQAFFEPLKQGITTDYPIIIKITQLGSISPHNFKKFIAYYKELEQIFPQLKLFFYFDVNHENFDRAFDHCSLSLLSKIYRLEIKKIERSFESLLEQYPIESQFDKWIKFFIFEEVKLSWRSIAS